MKRQRTLGYDWMRKMPCIFNLLWVVTRLIRGCGKIVIKLVIKLVRKLVTKLVIKGCGELFGMRECGMRKVPLKKRKKYVCSVS